MTSTKQVRLLTAAGILGLPYFAPCTDVQQLLAMFSCKSWCVLVMFSCKSWCMAGTENHMVLPECPVGFDMQVCAMQLYEWMPVESVFVATSSRRVVSMW